MKAFDDIPNVTAKRPDGVRPLRYRVGERIRQSRKRQGLTMQQVGDRLNTTPQTIQRLETGNMTMSLDWLEAIASTLDIPVTVLFDDVLCQEHFRKTDLLAKVAAFSVHLRSLSAHADDVLKDCARP